MLLLQMVLCFAGEMVSFVKSSSMGIPPLISNPSSLPAPSTATGHPCPWLPALCPHLGQGQERSGCFLTCPVNPNLHPGPLSHVPCSQNMLGAGVQEPGASLSSQPHLTPSHQATETGKGSARGLSWEKHLTFQNNKAFNGEWRKKGSSPEVAINMPNFSI